MAKKTKKKEQWLLVKSRFNWADECDFEGLELWTQRDLNIAKQKAIDFFMDGHSFRKYFGTNEDVEFDSYASIFGKLEVKKLTAAEAKVIRKCVGESYGHGLSDIMESLHDRMAEEAADAADPL